MSDLQTLAQSYLPLLERYLLADDPQQFLAQEVNLPQDSQLFSLLLNEPHPKDEEYGRNLGISKDAQKDLETAKLWREARKATTPEQKQQLLKKIVEMYPSIKFDFPQPSDYSLTNPQAQGSKDEVKTNNVLQTEATVTDVVLKAIEERPANFQKLSAYGLRNFPIEKLKSLQQRYIGYLMSKSDIVRSLDPEQFSEVLSIFFTKALALRNSPHQQEFPEEIFKTLTTEQVLALKAKLPNLFQGYSYYHSTFRQKHEESLVKYKSLAQLSFDEKEQKKRLCESIITDLEKQNNDFAEMFIERLTEQILLIEQTIVDSNLNRFLKYLSNLKSIAYDFFEPKFKDGIKQRSLKAKRIQDYKKPLQYLDSSKISQSELISRTIVSLLKNQSKQTIEQLAPFISRYYLVREEIKVKLAKGKQNQIQNLYDYFNVAEVGQIKDRKMLTFTDSNKKLYKIDEDVTLQLTIKNVQTITVKLFSINLQKHYQQNGGEVNEQMNLKYLVPLQERKQEYVLVDGFQEQIIKIEMPELKEKLGMFIIELQAEGVTSRAVIRKGTIVCKNVITPIGHKLSFYDENGKLIEKLQLWRDGKKFQVSKYYVIPFGNQRTENLIIVYQNYAQKESINVENQNYSLSVDYVYHSESFIVGHKAKIIIRPQLLLSTEKISLSRLEKASIKVSTINNQNISHSITHDNIAFKDNQDFCLEIPVKSYLSTISVDLEVEIEKIDKSRQKLTSNRTIAIDLEESNDNFIDTYLEKEESGHYILKVRGKNGESIPNASGNFSYEQFGADFSFSKMLVSDEKGIFMLGKLLQVKKLTVTVSYANYSTARSWKINNYSQSISYGGPIFNNSYKLYFKQGQNFSLPLPSQLQETDLVFYKENVQLGTFTNCVSTLKIQPTKLSVQNLTVGRYTLLLLRYQRRIDFEVIKGKNWIGNDLIDEENTIYKINKERNYITLGELKSEAKQNHTECSVDVIANFAIPKDMRVHIFAKNYIDADGSEFYTSSGVKKIINETSRLNLKKSSYYSDKSLSDETAYVLNRKKQDITAGNNLEKPHIFLKRIEVRGTDTKDEVLKTEGQYSKKMEKNAQFLCSKASAAPVCYNSKMAMNQMYDFANFDSRGGYGFGRSAEVSLQRKLNTHNNFLKEAGHLSSNITNLQSIIVPKTYSHLVVYLFYQDISIRREYSIPHSDPELINLTHNALVDASEKEGWTMSRQIYPVLQGQQKEINRNCTWTTVSKANVVEYATTMGHNLPDWLSNWHLYSPVKQLQVYDKQFSHELNFFLYKNDRSFFDKVVKPFLANRIKKTFIDLYLLESEEVLEYAKTHRLEKMNYFETVLLVQRLRMFGREKQAQNLANSMELALKNTKQSGQAFKVFFETILNAKKTNNVPPPPIAFAPSMMAPPPPPAGLFGASIQPQSYMLRDMAQECEQFDQCMVQNQCCVMQCQQAPYYPDIIKQAQEKFKPGFKETQKTREYTDTTYAGVTNPHQYPLLVPSSLFWAELARHYSSKDNAEDFLSDKFWAFSSKREFILACSVLPHAAQADYELRNKDGNYLVEAKSSFLTFTREVKALPFVQAKSIVLNQRFFDPKQRYTYEEDGTQCEREVDSFLTLKTYSLQTIVTNISGSALQVQLLIDIPEGSIPLKNHEQTQINNVTINPYNTVTFQREFYFPSEGKYGIYPANASRNRTIIAKSANIPPLVVTRTEIISKKQTFDNILRSGTNEEVYAFLESKNIFDNNQFDFRLILWKLKDKEFYEKCLSIFKKRNYFQPIVWSFGILHNDFETAWQFFENRNRKSLGFEQMDCPIFEYYPYYSSRVHKFANENKSTIRVKQFRQTYAQFLLSTIFEQNFSDEAVSLTLIYYLLLQDRINDAIKIYSKTPASNKKLYQLQYDYIDCYLDMCRGGENNYQKAREISEKYKEYPVAGWRRLFLDVYETLSKSDEELQTEESGKSQQGTFTTNVSNSGSEIKINRPAQTKVTVNFYKIELELYFSEFPFQNINNFSSTVTPTKSQQFQGANFQVHTLLKSDYSDLGDCIVEIYQHKKTSAPSIISKFFWGNPDVKVKINQNQGTLKVFYKNKKCSTSYCKVYSRGGKGERFYRDGYTDIASTFRYALDQKDINEFAILVLTDFGGSLHRVKPPALQ